MLTEGALMRILDGEDLVNPVLQILAYKNVGTDATGGQERYRLLMSDGMTVHQFCIMPANLVERLKNGEFEKFTVIRLLKYTCNRLQEKKIIIMHDVEVVAAGNKISGRIGNPSAPKNNSLAGALQANNDNVSSSVAVSPGKNITNQPRPSPGGRKRTFNDTLNVSDGSINPSSCLPINALNPYQSKWAIKGRVTSKSGIKTWNNAKGEGKLFSFNLQDDSGEIKIAAFKNECDKFFDLVELNKVYLVSKGVIKPANKKFSSVNNDFELSLISDTILERIDDDISCPQIQYNFVKIIDIENAPENSFIDVLAVCKDAGEMAEIKQKSTGKELKKRDILLIDDSNAEIKLTIWGDDAVNFAGGVGSALVVKKARVSDFNGKSLNLTGDSALLIDPKMPEAFQVKGWFNRERTNLANVTSLSNSGGGNNDSNFKYFCDVSPSKNPVFYTSKCLILSVASINFYPSCPGGCKKKLIDMNDGTYKCDKCNKDHTTYDMKMLMKLCISDCTIDCWATVFNDEAEKLLNIKAKDLNELKQMGSPEYEDVTAALNFQSYIFRLKTAEEHYNEELRLKTTVMGIKPLDTIDYSRKLIAMIKEMENN